MSVALCYAAVDASRQSGFSIPYPEEILLTTSKPFSSHFTAADVEILHKEALYQGFFRMEKQGLRHRLFEGGWSEPIEREVFLRGNAVAAVMYDPKHRLIGLVEQFRIGALENNTGPWLLEVVAGMIDKNETPQQVVERELVEEAGFTPEKTHFICDYYSSPGGTTERLSLFCAVGDLSHISGIYGLEEEGEDIKVHTFDEKTVFEQLYSGRFNNAATLICLQWLLIHHSTL